MYKRLPQKLEKALEKLGFKMTQNEGQYEYKCMAYIYSHDDEIRYQLSVCWFNKIEDLTQNTLDALTKLMEASFIINMFFDK